MESFYMLRFWKRRHLCDNWRHRLCWHEATVKAILTPRYHATCLIRVLEILKTRSCDPGLKGPRGSFYVSCVTTEANFFTWHGEFVCQLCDNRSSTVDPALSRHWGVLMSAVWQKKLSCSPGTEGHWGSLYVSCVTTEAKLFRVDWYEKF